jgi:hypothetical protein
VRRNSCGFVQGGNIRSLSLIYVVMLFVWCLVVVVSLVAL